ncbi:UDP-glucuronosyltransferase 2C1-like isoform X1 [Megalops cyprinoides]|uniref:UDP-glucuronosyltransferase 2C1-like isoform X1 n=1 Tax=Megalops cyprinoides TaxID=118141 RepID=UPI0018650560|nr:UDP-glucuronosyltransferase 2C1-like isoform X1 [Megalops cyprinoides]
MEMYLTVFFLTTLLILTLPGIHGGKVLVFPLDGSHWVNMKVLIEELHAKGHSVTVVRASSSWYIEETSPHYTSVTVHVEERRDDEEVYSTFVSRLLQIQREGRSVWTRFNLEVETSNMVKEMHERICEMVVQMFEDQSLMQSLHDAQYDLVLTDPAVGGGILLAYYLGLPIVLNVRWTIHGEGHFAIAPSPLSYVPIPGAELTDNMSFFQRVQNLFAQSLFLLQIALIVSPPYSSLCHRYFGPGVDYFSLFQAADIWLMRVDFVFEFPRPTMPNVVYMGGFQCKPSKPLPEDLEEFVQSSGEHGVIIMSLGTVFGQLPHDIADEIAAAFAQLPQKVIWRYTGDRPATLGNNTRLVNWMPQNDLLGHPKTRVFVAHGGTNGVQETIYHGVPIVGLPLVFDQPDNLSRMKVKGAAKVLDFVTLNRHIFLQALQEVLHDPSYRMNMQRLSRLHRDQPMKPLDLALFWIEFVMRHKGAAHLRTESYKMPWYVYHSVDVIAVLLALMLLILIIVIAVIRFLCCRLCCKRKIKHD